VQSGKVLAGRPHSLLLNSEASVSSISLTPNSRTLVVCCSDGIISCWCWDVVVGQLLAARCMTTGNQSHEEVTICSGVFFPPRFPSLLGFVSFSDSVSVCIAYGSQSDYAKVIAYHKQCLAIVSLCLSLSLPLFDRLFDLLAPIQKFSEMTSLLLPVYERAQRLTQSPEIPGPEGFGKNKSPTFSKRGR